MTVVKPGVVNVAYRTRHAQGRWSGSSGEPILA